MATVTADSRATLRTSLGNLVLEFIPDKAPKTCENFVKLAHDGFYDGKTFHRIIKDFMVQGGCPQGNGKGGPGYTIRPEFNDTPHVKGTVSMARSNDPHSAGSQFFICTADARYLDSRYTAFARVVDGLDVLDKLNAVPTDIEPRFKEKSVPRDPVFINGVDLEGVTVEADEGPAGGKGSSEGQGGDGQGGGSKGSRDDDQDEESAEEGGEGRRGRRTRRSRRGGGSGRGDGGGRGDGDDKGRADDGDKGASSGGADKGRDGDGTGDLFAQEEGGGRGGKRAGDDDDDGGDDDAPARKASRKKASSKKATSKKSTSKKTTRKKATRKKTDDGE